MIPVAAGWVGAVNLRQRGSDKRYVTCIAADQGGHWVHAGWFAGLFAAKIGQGLICAQSRASLDR